MADLDNELQKSYSERLCYIESELQFWFVWGMLPLHSSNINYKYFVSKEKRKKKAERHPNKSWHLEIYSTPGSSE